MLFLGRYFVRHIWFEFKDRNERNVTRKNYELERGAVHLYHTRDIWAASWQNQQNECAPSEGSDQPGIRPV